jgi:multidrug efflux pump subunit AcrA (membrane-fusion protein)
LIIIGAIALGTVVVWLGRSLAIGSPTTLPSETARATRREISSAVKATGVLRAAIDAEVRVGVQSPGVLRRLHVRLGESVSKGQLLAELESRSLRAKQSQAVAAVRSSQANLDFETSELARKRKLVEQEALRPVSWKSESEVLPLPKRRLPKHAQTWLMPARCSTRLECSRQSAVWLLRLRRVKVKPSQQGCRRRRFSHSLI